MDLTASCYEAERIPYHRGFVHRFVDTNAAQTYLNHITTTRWFTNRHGTINPPTIKPAAGSGHWSQYQPWDNTIRLAAYQMDDMTVLHELAHLLAYTPPPNEHNTQYRRTYLALVTRFMGTEAGRSLRYGFLAHGLNT